mmetsp:Transcript_1111/g.2664  ORF Transcript_1111/g.2664 Transcript_1111/m.2664 type:complete len:700 (-) Transcript_1111:370-2469(-)
MSQPQNTPPAPTRSCDEPNSTYHTVKFGKTPEETRRALHLDLRRLLLGEGLSVEHAERYYKAAAPNVVNINALKRTHPALQSRPPLEVVERLRKLLAASVLYQNMDWYLIHSRRQITITPNEIFKPSGEGPVLTFRSLYTTKADNWRFCAILEESALFTVVDLRPVDKDVVYVNGAHPIYLPREKRSKRKSCFVLRAFWPMLRFYDICYDIWCLCHSGDEPLGVCSVQTCGAPIVRNTAKACAYCCRPLCAKCWNRHDKRELTRCCLAHCIFKPVAVQEIVITLNALFPHSNYKGPEKNGNNLSDLISQFENRLHTPTTPEEMKMNWLYIMTMQLMFSTVIVPAYKMVPHGVYEEPAMVELMEKAITKLAHANPFYLHIFPLDTYHHAEFESGAKFTSYNGLYLSLDASTRMTDADISLFGDAIFVELLGPDRYDPLTSKYYIVKCRSCHGHGLIGVQIKFYCRSCIKPMCDLCLFSQQRSCPSGCTEKVPLQKLYIPPHRTDEIRRTDEKVLSSSRAALGRWRMLVSLHLFALQYVKPWRLERARIKEIQTLSQQAETLAIPETSSRESAVVRRKLTKTKKLQNKDTILHEIHTSMQSQQDVHEHREPSTIENEIIEGEVLEAIQELRAVNEKSFVDFLKGQGYALKAQKTHYKYRNQQTGQTFVMSKTSSDSRRSFKNIKADLRRQLVDASTLHTDT